MAIDKTYLRPIILLLSAFCINKNLFLLTFRDVYSLLASVVFFIHRFVVRLLYFASMATS